MLRGRGRGDGEGGMNGEREGEEGAGSDALPRGSARAYAADRSMCSLLMMAYISPADDANSTNKPTKQSNP